MRTIKFRGFSIQLKEWVYGNLIVGLSQDYYILVYSKNGFIKFEVEEKTVGQFTSLYDKNKKEIYEGDILKVQGTREKIEVRFVRGVFAFLWNGNLDDEAPINAPTQEWAEVIGNIHDNPNILKRKNNES